MVVNKASDNQLSYSTKSTHYDRSVIQGSALHYLHENQVHSALWQDVSDYELDDITAQHAVWQAKGASDYSFEVIKGCVLCDAKPIYIEVENGEFSAAYADEERTEQLTQQELTGVPLTIDEVLTQLTELTAEYAEGVTVEYNHRYGFPDDYRVDPDPSVADDEFSTSIRAYQPIYDDIPICGTPFMDELPLIELPESASQE